MRSDGFTAENRKEGSIMKRTLIGLIVLGAFVLAGGCATNDSTVPASTGVGAGAGALLGYGLTGSGYGAAAGAGAGALAGALTGVVIDESRRKREEQARAEAYQEPPPQYQPAPQAYATSTDPTEGQFLNDTRWRLEVYLDNAGEPVRLGSRQSYPIALDIGEHLVVAKAFVSTQFGERLVGTYDHTIYIDPKGSGWSLRFDESMFS